MCRQVVFNYEALNPFAAADINKVQNNNVVSTEAVGFGPRRASQAAQGQPMGDWTAFTR